MRVNNAFCLWKFPPAVFSSQNLKELQPKRKVPVRDTQTPPILNNKEARAEVVELVEALGLRGFHSGPIANSAAAEALTSVIININRAYKCHAGIRITGIPDAGS